MFVLLENCACVEASPRIFYKKLKLSIPLDQQSEI